jgi:hypothetical protein
VSDSTLHWFHCGRCGSLFQARAGELENRLCGKCGFDPATGILEAAEAGTPVGAALPAARPGAQGASKGKRGTRKRGGHLMLKIIGGWTLALALIILGANHYWGGPAARPAKPPVETSAADTDTDRTLLDDAAQPCVEVFSRFVAATTPEERNQFVSTPVSTVTRMARFYSLNPLANIDPSTLALTHSSVLSLPDGKAIEMLWKSRDGLTYDTVFRKEGGEWRLDWEHFARHGEFPWSQFLAGDGPDEAEFRLLARERLAKERRNESTISLVLYAPRFGRPEEEGFQSPELLVSRQSTEGRQLDAAFKLARDGGRPLGSTLPQIDPDEMIRVRVMVKRSGENGERRFGITAVKACHWYSADDPPPATERRE